MSVTIILSHEETCMSFCKSQIAKLKFSSHWVLTLLFLLSSVTTKAQFSAGFSGNLQAGAGFGGGFGGYGGGGMWGSGYWGGNQQCGYNQQMGTGAIDISDEEKEEKKKIAELQKELKKQKSEKNRYDKEMEFAAKKFLIQKF